MKRKAKWILGIGMVAFCLQLKPCPHGNCPAGSCLLEGPQPMGWTLLSNNPEAQPVTRDSIFTFEADSLQGEGAVGGRQ